MKVMENKEKIWESLRKKESSDYNNCPVKNEKDYILISRKWAYNVEENFTR